MKEENKQGEPYDYPGLAHREVSSLQVQGGGTKTEHRSLAKPKT